MTSILITLLFSRGRSWAERGEVTCPQLWCQKMRRLDIDPGGGRQRPGPSPRHALPPQEHSEVRATRITRWPWNEVYEKSTSVGWEEAGYNYLQHAYFVYKEKTFKTKSQLSELRKKGTRTATAAARVARGAAAARLSSPRYLPSPNKCTLL